MRLAKDQSAWNTGMGSYILLWGVTFHNSVTQTSFHERRPLWKSVFDYPLSNFDIRARPRGCDHQCKGSLSVAGSGENREGLIDDRLSGRTKKWGAESGGSTREWALSDGREGAIRRRGVVLFQPSARPSDSTRWSLQTIPHNDSLS